MKADLVYLIAGIGLLLAVVLPALLRRSAVSPPIVLVSAGMLIGLTPMPDGAPLDPMENHLLVEHLTEVTVIVALMGVGLALDRPLEVRRFSTWRTWGPTWRMLGIAMPLCIAAVAVLGLALGLGLAAALLVGAVLAPTDPVLASDVQVAGPRTGEHEVDEPDEVRFALTSEAGLNDGLAFPFVYAAILLAGAGAFPWGEWLGWYVAGKVVIGVVAGIAVGRGLAWVAFRAPPESLRVAERGEALTAVAALVTAYGLTEVVGGYGFLAVFACAMTFRSAERSHDYHEAMHEVTERLERLLTLIVLLALGVALTRGVFDHLDWRGVLVGLGLILVIRPISGLVAMAGSKSRLTGGQRVAIAFFGVRGIGSIYYLAYATGHAHDLVTEWMWSTVAFTIVTSVLVHGVLATPVMRRIGDDDRDRDPVG